MTKFSYRRYLSSAQMLGYRFGNGRFLSNAEDLACHTFPVFLSQILHDTYNELLAWLGSQSSNLELRKQYKVMDTSTR